MIKLFGKRAEKERKDTVDRKTSIEQEYRSSVYRENLALHGAQIEASILKSDIEKENEKIIMQAQVEDLIKKYTNLKTGIKSTEGNNKTRRELEKRLDQNIKNLNNIKADLEKYTYDNSTTFKARIGQLIYHFQHYEQIRQDIVLGRRTSDIPSFIDSKQDAKRTKRYKESDAKYQQSMNEILHSAAITSLWNNDMERYEEYLKLVVNGQIEPSSHPFYKAHEQSFNQLRNTNPSLYQALVPSGAGRTQYRVVVGAPESGTISGSTIRTATQSESFPSRLGKGFGELLGNIFPSIENNPRQKQAREQAGAAVALCGAALMGFKMLKNIFSSKEKNPNKRRDAALRGGGLLALVNGDKIIRGGKDWVQDAFNWHPAEKIQASTELFQKYGFSDTDAIKYSEMQVGAPVALMSALHFVPIYELNAQKIVEYKNNEFQFNYDNYKNYINNYNRTAEQKKIVLDAGKQLKEDNVTNLAFIGLGIKDGNQLNGLAHGSKNKTLADCPEVQDAWEENAELVSSSVNAELFKQGLKPIDTEAQKQIVKEYNAHGGENIKKSELKQLIILRMREGLLKINGEVQYDLEDMIKDPNIDLEKKTMKGFKNDGGNEIPFDSYKELFDIVWLTQRIKKNFKKKPTAHGNIVDIFTGIEDDEPFHINIKFPKDRGHIEFNNKEFWSIYGDTDVLKSGTLRKISDTLKGNKQFYCDYLNERRKNKGKHGIM